MTEILAWHEGKLVPESELTMPVKGPTILYGIGAFEGVRAYNGNIFAAESHAKRLINSSALIGEPIKHDVPTIINAMETTLEAFGKTDAYIRPTVLVKNDKMGVHNPDDTTELVILITEWKKAVTDAAEKGISLTTSFDVCRHSHLTHKVAAKANTNYQNSKDNIRKAISLDFDDAAIPDINGNLVDTSAANIILEKDGELFTPKRGDQFHGITIQVGTTLAKELNIPLHEIDIPMGAIHHFNHAFIVGTAAEITPIRQIDERKLEISDNTRKLQQAYHDLTHQKSHITVDGYSATIDRLEPATP